ncbi:MAG TPA: GGDEF domain-containing protein [Candidatus Acidoferrales bacterium]|nr:GGDEF domain-containing protein [Candidatus Acidoferrales bacterium]
MQTSVAPGTVKNTYHGADDIQSSLRKLERRDMWASGSTAIIILGLTALVVSLSVSLYLKAPKAMFGWDLSLAVWALVGLVLFFTGHMIFQQFRLRTVQRELSEQQIQAEVFKRLALFDPLTGLYNRRFAEERLRAEIGRAERRGLSMVVVLLDLNDFKKINDKHGHPAGDEVLKEFAKCLTSSTRGSDLAVRWGGDEFMLLLLDCEIDQLSVVLSRLVGLRVNVSGTELEVLFSVGWKAYETGDQFEGLIEAADRNLYVHKAASKVSNERLTAPVGD